MGSSDLMKVQLNNIENTVCHDTYKTFRAMDKGVLSSQFCAGEMLGKKDTCQGDSGGGVQVGSFYPHHFSLSKSSYSFLNKLEIPLQFGIDKNSHILDKVGGLNFFTQELGGLNPCKLIFSA